MHLGAVALVAGALGGLYLRGLVLEYEMTWESTFLTLAGTERALRFLFAPASALTGIDVPPLTPSGGDAAPWIHLYAVTVLLAIVLPRALMAGREGRSARRLAAALPLPMEDAYFRRLASAHQGHGLDVALVPYSHEPERETHENLMGLLHDLFGARARVTKTPSLAYGAEADELLAAAGDDASQVVVVFGLAQTPETEVHGRLIADLLRLRLEEPVLWIVDGTGYRERLGGGETALRRADEHARSWDRVLRDAGGVALHLDLRAPAQGAFLEAAAAQLERRGERR